MNRVFHPQLRQAQIDAETAEATVTELLAPSQSLCDLNLSRVSLISCSLPDSDLRGTHLGPVKDTNLIGSLRDPWDPPIPGWHVREGKLYPGGACIDPKPIIPSEHLGNGFYKLNCVGLSSAESDIFRKRLSEEGGARLIMDWDGPDTGPRFSVIRIWVGSVENEPELAANLRAYLNRSIDFTNEYNKSEGERIAWPMIEETGHQSLLEPVKTSHSPRGIRVPANKLATIIPLIKEFLEYNPEAQS